MKKITTSLLVATLVAPLGFSCFACGNDTLANIKTPEQAYEVLRENNKNIESFVNSATSFTFSAKGSQSQIFTLDETNTNLGSTNASGVAWQSETEKQEAIQDQKTALSELSYNEEERYQVAYNGNGTGYINSYMTNNGKEHTESQVLKKDGSKYYLYYVEDEEKYQVDKDYYKSMRDEALDGVDEYTYFVHEETLEEQEDFFGSGMFTDCEIEYTKKNGIGQLKFIYEISESIPPSPTSALQEIADFTQQETTQIITIKFNNKAILSVNLYREIVMKGEKKINSLDNSGAFAINFMVIEEEEIGFSTTYNPSLCPTIKNETAFADMGEKRIFVEYYVDGHYLFNSSSNYRYGEEVEPFVTGAGLGLKSDITWYLDEACTIPFTAETYFSYNFKLYAKGLDVFEEGYGLVALDSFQSEDEYQSWLATGEVLEEDDYHYYIYSVTGLISGIGNYECVYVNGERYDTTNKDQITLASGQLNYIVNIFKPR